MVAGRGEGLKGIKPDFAQVGFGLLPHEVIGVAQGLDQALDSLRGWSSGRGRIRGETNWRRGNEEQQQDARYQPEAQSRATP